VELVTWLSEHVQEPLQCLQEHRKSCGHFIRGSGREEVSFFFHVYLHIKKVKELPVEARLFRSVADYPGGQEFYRLCGFCAGDLNPTLARAERPVYARSDSSPM